MSLQQTTVTQSIATISTDLFGKDFAAKTPNKLLEDIATLKSKLDLKTAELATIGSNRQFIITPQNLESIARVFPFFTTTVADWVTCDKKVHVYSFQKVPISFLSGELQFTCIGNGVIYVSLPMYSFKVKMHLVNKNASILPTYNGLANPPAVAKYGSAKAFDLAAFVTKTLKPLEEVLFPEGSKNQEDKHILENWSTYSFIPDISRRGSSNYWGHAHISSDADAQRGFVSNICTGDNQFQRNVSGGQITNADSLLGWLMDASLWVSSANLDDSYRTPFTPRLGRSQKYFDLRTNESGNTLDNTASIYSRIMDAIHKILIPLTKDVALQGPMNNSSAENIDSWMANNEDKLSPIIPTLLELGEELTMFVPTNNPEYKILDLNAAYLKCVLMTWSKPSTTREYTQFLDGLLEIRNAAYRGTLLRIYCQGNTISTHPYFINAIREDIFQAVQNMDIIWGVEGTKWAGPALIKRYTCLETAILTPFTFRKVQQSREWPSVDSILEALPEMEDY